MKMIKHCDLNGFILSFENVNHKYDDIVYYLYSGGWMYNNRSLLPDDNEIITYDFLKTYPESTFKALLKLALFAKNVREYRTVERTKNGSHVSKVICEEIYNNFKLSSDELKTLLPVMTSSYNGCGEFNKAIDIWNQSKELYNESDIESPQLYCSLFASSVDLHLKESKFKPFIYKYFVGYYCKKYLQTCYNSEIDDFFKKAVVRALNSSRDFYDVIFTAFSESGYPFVINNSYLNLYYNNYSNNSSSLNKSDLSNQNESFNDLSNDDDYYKHFFSFNRYFVIDNYKTYGILDAEKEKMINVKTCKNCKLHRADECFGEKEICELFQYAPV